MGMTRNADSRNGYIRREQREPDQQQTVRSRSISHAKLQIFPTPCKSRPLENIPEGGSLCVCPFRDYFTSSLRQVPSLMRITFTPATGALI